MKNLILEKKWNDIASAQLVGKKIVAVSYMTDKEAKSWGWTSRGVVISLDDGSYLLPSADDEGNGAGALFTSDKKHPVLPVLPAFLTEEQA
jgi:hypothetical protein